MTANITAPERSLVSVWMQAIRAFAFPASIVPVLVGALLTLNSTGEVRWELFPLVVICAILYHAATNLMSDYFDYQKGVDKNYTFGSSRVVTDGLLIAKQILKGAWLVFGVAIALGFILIAVRGMHMFILGLVGFLGGYLYCGKPMGFKYIALGDIGVFTLMGPLMTIGSYYTLTGEWNMAALRLPLLVSIPIGLLTAGILQANNTRDIVHDAEARIKTFSGVIGHKAAKVEYFFLILGAFVSVIWMVAAKVLPIYSLAVLLSLPPALKNLKQMAASKPGNVEDIATLDVQTAQHHLMFGVLLAAGIVIGAVVK